MAVPVHLSFLLQLQTLNIISLELPFSRNVKTLNIEHMSLTFNTPHESRVNTLPFTAHKGKDYPSSSYIYIIRVKNKIYFKPNASQGIHFSIQHTLHLTFQTSDNELIFPSTPHPFFNTRFNSTFNFLQIYQNIKTEPNSCSVIIQNSTHHSAILNPGYIGYTEAPATNIKPLHLKVNDVNSLIHTVFHSYHPDLSEPKPPLCRSSLRKSHFEIHNLQTSQILNRPLPPLPYSPDIQQFLKKFKFEHSDVTDNEYLKLCSILVKYQNCYATYRNDVGQIATPFRIHLKPNAKLQTQRLSKILFIIGKNSKNCSRKNIILFAKLALLLLINLSMAPPFKSSHYYPQRRYYRNCLRCKTFEHKH